MNRYSIFFALILLGITAIITQVILIRELFIVFSGNELSIGIILANWLILEAAGSFIAGHKTNRIKNAVLPYTILQGFLALLIPLIIYSVRIIPSTMNLIPGESIDIFTFFYISFLLLLPVGLINGAQFSLGCKLLSHFEKKGASLVGRTYALEAIGSMLGGLIATYICLQYLNTIQTVFLLAILNVISAILLLNIKTVDLKISQSRKLTLAKTGHFGLLFILLLMTATGGIDFLHKRSIEKQWKGYEIVSYENSIYGNVTLLKRSDQWHLLANGLTMATFPTPDIAGIEDMAHLPLLFHPDPKDVCLLGGGITGIVEELLKYNLTTIDYAELDPLLINTILSSTPDSIMMHLRSNQINTHFLDGRYFLRMTKRKYDILILSIPEPSTLVLNRFYTSEFFELCQSRLKNQGIIIFQIPGSSSYMNTQLAKLTNSLLNTASTSFDFQRIFPFEKTLVLLSNNKILGDITPELLSSRLKQRQISTQILSDLYFKYKLDSTRIVWFNSERSKVDEVFNNSDLKPAGLYYDLLYWNSSHSPSVASFFSWFENLSFSSWIIFIIVIFIIQYYFRVKEITPPNSRLIVSIVSTGFIGIGITIIFILAFQSLYGFVYSWVGMIISAFMVGLSGGSFWGAKNLKNNIRAESLFYRLEGIISVYLVSMILVLFSIETLAKIDNFYMILPYCVLLFTLVCGIFVGAQFPIAARLYQKNPDQFSQTAGIMYASDLLGAWAGGIVITLILIPILGTLETIFLLFLIKVCSTVNFRLS
jgi:spermidine synthase